MLYDSIRLRVVTADPDVLDMVLSLKVCQGCDERFAVIRNNLCERAPSAGHVLKDPIAKALCGLLAQHSEFRVAGKRAAPLCDVRIPARSWQVHSVHVHLTEERRRRHYDWWN